MWVVLSQTKNGLPASFCRLDEILRRRDEIVVAGLHALLGERAGILDLCLPTLPQRGSSVGSSLSVAQECITPRGPNFFRKFGKSFSSG